MLPDGHEVDALLAPIQAREFLKRYWGRKSLYIRGTPDKFAHLAFDLATLERAIRDQDGRDRMRVRFVGGNNKVHRQPANLTDFSIRNGVFTVCADWINDRFERLAAYCAGVKTGLQLPGSVFMTCYASPDGHGFATHWDGQASFILQIEGSKRWRFARKPEVAWPPVVLANVGIVPEMIDRYPWLRVRFPDARDEATFAEQVLEPGDVLFLPAGTWHRAEAIGYSVALTMACVPRTMADFVDDLVRGRLSTQADWRSNVPPVLIGGTPPDRLPPTVKRFFDARLAELRREVRALRAEDLFEAWAHHVGAFDNDLAPESSPPARAVAETDTLALAPPFPVRFVERRAEGTVVLYRANQRVTLAAAAMPLVKRITKGRPFAAGSAAMWLGEGFGWDGVRPALQALIDAGILVRSRPVPSKPVPSKPVRSKPVRSTPVRSTPVRSKP